MVKVTFKYCDRYTDGRWNTQTCVVDSVEECKQIYGLGIDCEYVIVSVERVEE